MSVLKLVIWNVEHGNAISIITPNGKLIAHDLGANSNSGFSPVKYSYEGFHRKKYDALIVTHPHRDHIDDILQFYELGLHKTLRHFIRPMSISSVDEVVQPSQMRNSDALKYERYFEFHEFFKNTHITKKSPLHPANNGGVKFEFFKPKRTNNLTINNQSVVTIISFNGQKVLLSGDNEVKSWKLLLKDWRFRNAIKGTDILLASHHGRENGYCQELFQYFSPKLVVVSDGKAVNTNAVRRYIKHVEEPFDVFFSNQDRIKKRKCLTTRKDNAITISLTGSSKINVKTK